MAVTEVHSSNDPLLSDYQRLNDSAFRRSIEAAGPFQRGIIVVEGWLAIERLLRSRYQIRSVLVEESKLSRCCELLGGLDVPVLCATREVIEGVVGFDLHRGIVAIAERGLPASADSVIRRSKQLLLLEGIGDGENMGSLLRNAAALGADGVVLDSSCCDPLSRRSIRVSVGHALRLEIARSNTPALLDSINSREATLLALTPGPDSEDLYDLDPKPSGPLAIAMGSEGTGLSREVLDRADRRLRIPMAADVDSLNVSAAAAVALSWIFDPIGSNRPPS